MMIDRATSVKVRISLHMSSEAIAQTTQWMFLILLLAWLLKTTSTNLPTNAAETHVVGSFAEWVRNAAIGPVPGLAVITAVGSFYFWILLTSFRAATAEGELAFGDVHV
jgi:uncharacterized membrane protein